MTTSLSRKRRMYDLSEIDVFSVSTLLGWKNVWLPVGYWITTGINPVVSSVIIFKKKTFGIHNTLYSCILLALLRHFLSSWVMYFSSATILINYTSTVHVYTISWKYKSPYWHVVSNIQTCFFIQWFHNVHVCASISSHNPLRSSRESGASLGVNTTRSIQTRTISLQHSSVCP